MCCFFCVSLFQQVRALNNFDLSYFGLRFACTLITLLVILDLLSVRDFTTTFFFRLPLCGLIFLFLFCLYKYSWCVRQRGIFLRGAIKNGWFAAISS